MVARSLAPGTTQTKETGQVVDHRPLYSQILETDLYSTRSIAAHETEGQLVCAPLIMEVSGDTFYVDTTGAGQRPIGKDGHQKRSPRLSYMA